MLSSVRGGILRMRSWIIMLGLLYYNSSVIITSSTLSTTQSELATDCWAPIREFTDIF